MTSQERVMNLFESANPVPERGSIARPKDASGYLSTIQRESSTMTLTAIEPETSDNNNQKRPWILVAAAVAALALIGGLIYAGNVDDEQVPADQPVQTVPDATTTVASSAATAGELDGIWWKPSLDVSRDMPIIYQFGPGDLFVLDGQAQLTDPVFRGRHTFVDDVVTYLDNEIVDGPCSGTGGQTRLAITIVDDGEIGTEVLEEGECSGTVGDSAPTIRLSPASTAGAAITPPDGEFDDTLAFPSLLKGVWLREGTGEVVYFHPDNTYARSDTGDVVANPDDRGTFVLVTPDAADDNELAKIVMTSDGTSKCAAGSTLTWDAVQWNQVPLRSPSLGIIGAVHTIADDACGMSSGNQTWIHVSGA